MPAHREYFLTRVCGESRDQWYNGQVYRREVDARRDADDMNAHRDQARYGRIVVEHVDRPAAVVMVSDGFCALALDMPCP